jgi:gluconokinase
MGVSGCGKSSVGALLAARLSCPFAEGDDYHPEANRAKMAAGIPLQDEDRQDWLLALQERIRAARLQGESLVLSCSALKRRYRDLLRAGDPDLVFVHLHGPRELIAQRMAARPGHFMPTSLLDSQLADLEALGTDEAGIVVDIHQGPAHIVDEVLARLRPGPVPACPPSPSPKDSP